MMLRISEDAKYVLNDLCLVCASILIGIANWSFYFWFTGLLPGFFAKMFLIAIFFALYGLASVFGPLIAYFYLTRNKKSSMEADTGFAIFFLLLASMLIVMFMDALPWID